MNIAWCGPLLPSRLPLDLGALGCACVRADVLRGKLDRSCPLAGWHLHVVPLGYGNKWQGMTR